MIVATRSYDVDYQNLERTYDEKNVDVSEKIIVFLNLYTLDRNQYNLNNFIWQVNYQKK